MSNISRDDELFQKIDSEVKRQQEHIELIASENFTSKQVREAQGSVLTNKYAEGYSGRRYYGGCEYIDEIEELAITRLKKIYDCEYANVQPHSGTQANIAVFLALLQPGDTIMGMGLDMGGHLTHGSKVTMSGKWFNSISYGVDSKTNLLDYDQVASLAKIHKPKVIIAGGSAYSRIIDFAKFRQIADSVGAYLMVDMAHFAGLVAGNEYPSPLPFADVVTSTTHKTLRGPRGGLIVSNNQEIAKKLNSGVFPGSQGGPLMHVIAAKAVAFFEALQPEFKKYAKHVVKNAQAFADYLHSKHLPVITGGTDTHLFLLDLRDIGISGKDAEYALEQCNIVCNKNTIPFDPAPPAQASGLRIGTPAMTTRGFGVNEFKKTADLMLTVLQHQNYDRTLIKQTVLDLCSEFPAQ